MTKLRAVIYDRVSTDEQHTGKQLRQLRAHAERLQLDVIDVVEEKASGASPLPLRAARVLAPARRGALDVVLCWNTDRWSRNAIDSFESVALLQRNGVRWIAVNEGIDLAAGAERSDAFEFAAVVAGQSRRRLRENTRIGLAAARARGVRLGRPRKLTAELCADVATLRAEGLSLRAIAATLGLGRGTVAAALEPTPAQLAQLDAQLARSYAAHNAAARRR